MTLKVPGEKMFYTTDVFSYIYFSTVNHHSSGVWVESKFISGGVNSVSRFISIERNSYN